MGAGDEGPAALEQIGAKVTMLGADDLASGNLAQFGAIVTGVRAYEKRDDLIANNSRLLQYVSNGGTLIVQYNRTAFNNAQYGPYPAQVTDDRVTDEHAPVTLLIPAHPVFTTPNRITPRSWEGWVQERGCSSSANATEATAIRGARGHLPQQRAKRGAGRGAVWLGALDLSRSGLVARAAGRRRRRA
jgi:hypothetical protein